MKNKSIKINDQDLYRLVCKNVRKAIKNVVRQQNKTKQGPILHWVVFYQVIDTDGKSSYKILRNVWANSPEEASRRILDLWSKGRHTSELMVKILLVVEDFDYES